MVHHFYQISFWFLSLPRLSPTSPAISYPKSTGRFLFSYFQFLPWEWYKKKCIEGQIGSDSSLCSEPEVNMNWQWRLNLEELWSAFQAKWVKTDEAKGEMKIFKQITCSLSSCPIHRPFIRSANIYSWLGNIEGVPILTENRETNAGQVINCTCDVS